MIKYFRRHILTHYVPSSREVNFPDEHSELRCSLTLDGTDAGDGWGWANAYRPSCITPYKQTVSFQTSMDAILESKIKPQTPLMQIRIEHFKLNIVFTVEARKLKI